MAEYGGGKNSTI